MASEIWFIKKDQQGPVYGPVSFEQLQEYWRTKKISDEMLLSQDKKTWSMAGQVMAEKKDGNDTVLLITPEKHSDTVLIEHTDSPNTNPSAQHKSPTKIHHIVHSDADSHKASTKAHPIIHPASTPKFTEESPAPSQEPVEPSIHQFSHYEIINEVGRGGMGIVYQAIDTQLNRIVALKVLLDTSNNEINIQRFFREAEINAKLSHPNIVHIYEVGSNPQYYIAMEFIEGRTFTSLLNEKTFTLRKKLEIFQQVCEAIEYAHKHKIIHRDLKPQNIIVTHEQLAKIMDFGLAKNISQHSKISFTGQVLGTPKYMSPEQADGKTVDHSTDIYSLGVILYEILTGRVPFDSDNVINILAQLANDKPTLPRQIHSSIPKELEAICMKCLEKNPRNRYLSAHVLANEIKAFLTNKPAPTRSPSGGGQTHRSNQGTPIKIFAVLVLLLICSIAALAYVFYETPEEKEFQHTKILVLQKREKESYPEAIKLWEDFLLRYVTTAHRYEIQENIKILQGLQDKKTAMQYTELINQAKSFLLNKNYEQAEEILMQAKKYNAQDTEVISLLGMVCYYKQEWTNAQSYFESIEAQLNGEMLTILAEIQNKQNQLPLTITTMNKAIAKFQKEKNAIKVAESYIILGGLYQKTANYDQAMAAYQTSAEIYLKNNVEYNMQPFSLYYNLALLYARYHQKDNCIKAIQICEKISVNNKKAIAQITNLVLSIADYTPIKTGNKWLYQQRYEDRTAQVLIEIIEQKQDKYIVKVNQEIAQEWYYQEGFFLRSYPNLNFTEKTLKYPIAYQPWTTPMSIQNANGKNVIVEVPVKIVEAGPTIVIKNVGTFGYCVKVETQLAQDVWRYEYYAPFIGKIKTETIKKVANLPSYTIMEEEIVNWKVY